MSCHASGIPAQTVLHCSHSGWGAQSPYFAFCNSAWADALNRLAQTAAQ